MQNVGRKNASNGLLQGRGQPGTHDVALGTSLLHAIRDLNTQTEGALALPVYDKSAFEGQGDRAARTTQVRAPIDIVLFEGWCLGFHSIPRAVLAERIATASQSDPPAFLSYSLEHLDAVNEQLRVWEQEWYPLVDAFVQFCPHATDGASPWSLVYPWRLQAEHAMKKANGGKGMSDTQVYTFVQRYVSRPNPVTCRATSSFARIYVSPTPGQGGACAWTWARIAKQAASSASEHRLGQVGKYIAIAQQTRDLDVRLGAHQHLVAPYRLVRNPYTYGAGRATGRWGGGRPRWECARCGSRPRRTGAYWVSIHSTYPLGRLRRRFTVVSPNAKTEWNDEVGVAGAVSARERTAILVGGAKRVGRRDNVAEVLLAVAALAHLRLAREAANEVDTRKLRGRRRGERLKVSIHNKTQTYAGGTGSAGGRQKRLAEHGWCKVVNVMGTRRDGARRKRVSAERRRNAQGYDT